MIRRLILDHKRVILSLLGIFGIYFLLRLPNLTILPVFADEAIYIRWSQVMRAEATLRFLPLSDGKQPLFMWLVIPVLKFISDPLVAGRLVSVVAGSFTLIGVILLASSLLKSIKIGLLSGLVLAIVPFSVFFDRMALADSLLAAFGVWTIYLSVLLIQYSRLDLAMITGFVLGGALLTKSPASFFAVSIPLTVLLQSFKVKKDLGKIIKLIGLWSVIYLLAYGIYSVLRLGPNFDMVAKRNADYVFPLKYVFESPFNPLLPHLGDVLDWFTKLFSWSIFITTIVGIVIGLQKYKKTAVFLILIGLLPIVVQSEYAKGGFTSRYVLFTVPFFTIFAGIGVSRLLDLLSKRAQIAKIALMVLLFTGPLLFDYYLLTNPEKASFSRNERSGYLEEWTAGTGIKEAAEYLRERAKKNSVFVGTEGFFGTLPDGLQMYLEKTPRITVVGIGLYPLTVPEPLINSLADNEVYLLINNDRLSFDIGKERVQLVKSFPKASRPDGTRQILYLLKVNP